MRRALEAAADAWGAIQRYGAALLMISMTALYGLNVLVRALLPQYASTFAWIDEAARYMLVWVVFLAAGIALEVGRHIVIDLLWRRLGARAERWLFALIDVVGLAFCALMMVLSIQLTIFVAGSGQISPTLGVPAYVLYVAPVVGFASLTFGFLLRIFAVRDARRTPPAAAWLKGTES
jgi:TRAP-type C4-dicarboxylate transport system permease small subunit